ncbi:hypothetical protein Q0M94_27395 (plasmid) [Deinococcus radiomollis]|uniref:hypothetical protein n=1 Tax=Deinococcus radiomollis TaxID=468916 RepID=UPI0038925B76
MRYGAEVYRVKTNELLVDLGVWESKLRAQMACLAYQRMILVWNESWPGVWLAEAASCSFKQEFPG